MLRCKLEPRSKPVETGYTLSGVGPRRPCLLSIDMCKWTARLPSPVRADARRICRCCMQPFRTISLSSHSMHLDHLRALASFPATRGHLPATPAAREPVAAQRKLRQWRGTGAVEVNSTARKFQLIFSKFALHICLRVFLYSIF